MGGETQMDFKDVVIIDFGSGITKAGFASDGKPRITVDTIISRSKAPELDSNIVFGSDALETLDQSKIVWPIRRGNILSFEIWSTMVKIIFDKLNVDPEYHPTLILEPILTPRKQRIKMAEILFESFNVPAVYFNIHTVAALRSTGRLTGLVVESGDGLTQISVLYENYLISPLNTRLSIGGFDITWYLMKLLAGRGAHISSLQDVRRIREIKERFCYFELSYKTTSDSTLVKKFDGREVELSSDRSVVLYEELFTAPEILFKPFLIGLKMDPLHEAITNTILLADIDLRWDLYQNIVISGGNTKIRNFMRRLFYELSEAVPELAKKKLRIVGLRRREYGAYIGATILAQMPAFNKMLVTKKEWREVGPDSVLRTI